MEKLITLAYAFTALILSVAVVILVLLLIVLLVGPQAVIEVLRQFVPVIK